MDMIFHSANDDRLTIVIGENPAKIPVQLLANGLITQ